LAETHFTLFIRKASCPRNQSKKRSSASASIPKNLSHFISDRHTTFQSFSMDVKLPQLAEGVESGTVVNIMVSEGQEIKKDQPFMELETQKAVGSIPAPNSGVVTKIHVKQGMEVSVGQVLISIETGAAASTAPAQTKPSQGSTSTPAGATSAPSRLQQTSVAPSPPSATAEDYHYQSA